MAAEIIECGINFLSFNRALELVPPEFVPAYEWFLKMEGKAIPRLPRGNDAPKLSAPIKLAAQRGMHSPDYSKLPSRGGGKKKYILSAVSKGDTAISSSIESVFYGDSEFVRHDDGTWTVEYASQNVMEGKKATDKSNEYMMNNLIDGVPVAYMTKGRQGYTVHGLAYVEAYSPITGMFTLHGPVSAELRGVTYYSQIAYDDLTDTEKEILRGSDDLEGEAFVAAQTMRRKHQDKFRRNVLSAYDGRCAITGVATQSVLQAAHIDMFSRSRSHAVSNGLLLRADIHLLYDAHLLTVLPESGKIVVSEAVRDPLYKELGGTKLRFPKHKELQPADDLLDIHRRSYNNCQLQLGLPCA